MNFKFTFSLLTYFVFTHLVTAQSDSVRYEKGFDFKEGIYLSLEEFKANNPSITRDFMIKQNITIQTIFGTEYKKENLEYIVDGEKVKLKKDSIWGYCKDDILFISVHNTFNRVLIYGSLFLISDQAHDITVYSFTQSGSYVIKDKTKGIVMDFSSGKKFYLNINTLPPLIKNDPELYKKFNNIKKKKEKEKYMLSIIREYNLRNPIYFPISDTN